MSKPEASPSWSETYEGRIDEAATAVLADHDEWYRTIGPLAGMVSPQVARDIRENLRARGIAESELPKLGSW